MKNKERILSMAGNIRLVDIECEIKRNHNNTIAIATGATHMFVARKGAKPVEQIRWFWLWKDSVEINDDDKNNIIVTMPEQLAIDKEII